MLDYAETEEGKALANRVEQKLRARTRRDLIVMATLLVTLVGIGWYIVGTLADQNCNAITELRDVQIANAQRELGKSLDQLDKAIRRNDGKPIIPGITNAELEKSQREQFTDYRDDLLAAQCG